MMRAVTFASLLLIAAAAEAQLELPKPLVLDGAAPAQRQVTGLAAPLQGDAGVSANADRTNATAFAQAQGTNALTLALTPTLTAYAPGLRVIMVPTAVNSGDATVDIDGLGPVPVRKNVNMALDSADLHPGVPVTMVYDGATFQLVNQTYPGCPVGYSAISPDVCIADQSNDSLSWFAAVRYCADRGARLCGFQEWIQGCLKLPAFVGTVSDYEWVDSAANYTNMAKNMGWTDTATAGDCHAGNRQLTTAKFRSRCCYDR